MGRSVHAQVKPGVSCAVAAAGATVTLGVILAGGGGSVGAVRAQGVIAGVAPPERIAVSLAIGNSAEGSGGIVLIDPSGRRVATLTRPRAGREDSAPAWSPDGRWLAFTRTTDGRRSFQIYVMRANGSGVRRITRGRFDFSPAWSPDGKWIAYQANAGLRLVRPDGTGGRAVPTRRPSEVGYPSWGPPGRIAYSYWASSPIDWPPACRQRQAWCGYVVSSRLDGGQRHRVVHGRDAHWSPDRRAIVYTGPDGGVYTAAASGGRGRMLGRGYLAEWSRSGRQIVYTRMGDRPSQDSVWIMNPDGGKAHRILRGGADPSWQP